MGDAVRTQGRSQPPSDIGAVTALRFVVFHDADKAHPLVRRWQQIMSELYPLHEERLRQSAAALAHHLRTFNLEQYILQAQETTALHSPVPGQAIHYKVRVIITPKQNGDDRLIFDVIPQSHNLVSLPDGLEIEIDFQYVGNLPIEDESFQYLADNFTANPLTTMPLDTYTSTVVKISRMSTEPSIYTRNKTTHRTPYNLVRKSTLSDHHAVPTEEEVLLQNPSGEVMEASCCSVFFFRDGVWITPAEECGGMKSVSVMYALRREWCEEGVVNVNSVRDGELVWLGNAVRGFFHGEVQGEDAGI
jgi:hypothetical protein